MPVLLFSRAPEGSRRRVWFAQSVLAGTAIATLAYFVAVRGGLEDLGYDYVTARGFLDGLDISSITVSDLSARYLPQIIPLAGYPWPNWHPPALVLADVPFALLPFPIASAVWMLTNIGLLLVVGRWLGLSRPASLALAAWPPLFGLLLYGQYELMMLFLVMAGWRAAKSGQDYRAGALIGLAAVVKFYPGLFVIPFLVQRRFRLVLSTCLVFLLGQVAGAWMLGGPLGLLGYYQRAAQAQREVILTLGGNSSPYTALLRLLDGVGGIPPLVYAPGLVWPITIALSLVGLLALLRLRPEAAPVAALVALPNSQFYCAVFALPQLVTLWRDHIRGGWYWRLLLVGTAIAISLILAIVNLVIIPILLKLGIDGQASLTMAASLLAVMPVGYATLLALSFLASRVVKVSGWDAEAPAPQAQEASVVE